MSESSIDRKEEAGGTPLQRLIGLVAKVLERDGAGRPLPLDARLSELGISSMKMISLMLTIEVEFGIAIPQADITPDNFESIASIEALILRLLASEGGG